MFLKNFKKFSLSLFVSSTIITGCLFICLLNSLAAPAAFQESLDKTAAGTGHNAIGMTSELPVLIGKIIYFILSFIGVIFLGLMIYAGYLWMLARGNEQQVEKARNIITNSIIGIIIIVSAYAITYLFLSNLI
jgi:hypothetical protein